MENFNKNSGKDLAYSLTKGGLGTIPVMGSLASEIFGLIVTPPLEKRRVEWMNEIAKRLKELEEKGELDLEKLGRNEKFLDIVLEATTHALKTSEKEKIKGFQNAILNTAKGESPDKTKSTIFLNQLNNFTVWHIKILKFIDNPKKWYEENNQDPPNLMMGSLSNAIIKAFPELENEDELLHIIWNDLGSASFHNSGGIKTTMSKEGILSERTTNFGKEFLDFITKKE